VRFYKNLDDLCANWSVDKTWKPAMDEAKRESMYKLWKKAVTRTFDWEEEAPKVEQPEKELVGTAN
jgi:glycerol kinase